MASNAFPTPFNINRIQGIPGPTGPQGPPGSSNSGVDISKAPYGADKTGATDCTAAFAAASTASASDPSGQVYIPAGTYKLSSTQSISGNLFFAPGAILKPTVNEVITCSGQIFAGDYQHIFDCSAGGTTQVLLPKVSEVSVCWFGADPTNTAGPSGAAINAAIIAAETPYNTTINKLQSVVFVPAGFYRLDVPVVIAKDNVEVRGEGATASRLKAQDYTGPGVVVSKQPSITQHLNDYDTTLASASIGDAGGSPNACPVFVLSEYGDAWALNGAAQFSIDLIVKITGTQIGSSFLLSSSGKNPDSSAIVSAFYITCDAADHGYSNTDCGIGFQLTTSGGTVTAQTAAGVINTGSTWYHLRFDYDGSAMRIFVNGVAATLASSGTSIAQTGTIVQSPIEAVKLGVGFSGGFAAQQLISYPPVGCRFACLRAGKTSRGSSNFTPPSGKYTEDGSTLCLIDFDVINNAGGLLFARTFNQAFGMQGAWLANAQESIGGNQIGGVTVRNLGCEVYGGPVVEAVGSPLCLFENLNGFGQSGILLHQDAYFTVVRRCQFLADGGWGMGIKIGPSSNFVHVEDINVQGYTANLYSEAICTITGGNYWLNAKYVPIYLSGNYAADFSGSNFVSDEGSSFHNLYGVICAGVGTVTFRGTIFGLQAYTDQTQVWIDNFLRPSIAGQQVSKISFDHCIFATNVSGPPAVLVSHTLAGDSVIATDCDYVTPMFALGTSSLARITFEPWEHEAKALTITDANYTIDINDWLYGKLVVSGTLTADRNFVVPTLTSYQRTIQNLTAHALLVKTSGGTGVYIPPGQTGVVSCDGTNVVLDSLAGTSVRLIVSGTSSTAFAWDQVVGVNVGTAYNLTGPTGTVAGQTFVVKDNSGAAGTNNITVTAPGGQTYDGAATIVIATDGGRASLLFDGGTNWMS